MHAVGDPRPCPLAACMVSSEQTRWVSISDLKHFGTAGLPLTVTVTYERLASLGQFHREVVQLLEVVTRVGNLPGLKAEPSNHLQNRVKVDSLFRIRVGVVKSASKSCLASGTCMRRSDMAHRR